MSKFKDNFSSESFYPDSNFYLDQDNAPKKDTITEDQRQTNRDCVHVKGSLLIEQHFLNLLPIN